MKRTLLTLIFLFFTLAASAQVGREVPTWKGVTKTPSDIMADMELIEAAKKLADGDLKLAAEQALQFGWQSIQEGKSELAVRQLNQAWLMNPENGYIYWGFAVAIHMRNDPLEDINLWFDKAHSILGESARMFTDRGRILDERDLPEQARQWFEKALDIDPEYAEAHIGMMRVGETIGDTTLRDKHKSLYDSLVQ